MGVHAEMGRKAGRGKVRRWTRGRVAWCSQVVKASREPQGRSSSTWKCEPAYSQSPPKPSTPHTSSQLAPGRSSSRPFPTSSSGQLRTVTAAARSLLPGPTSKPWANPAREEKGQIREEGEEPVLEGRDSFTVWVSINV